MTSAMQKSEDGTIALTITIPWEQVKKKRDEILEQTAKQANVPGFRKGKAPKQLVEDKVNEDAVREDVLKQLLPQAYVQAVTEQKITPIINPKIHVGKLEEGKDWEVTAQTAEIPDVQLGDYKKRVSDVTAKSKIVIPGKETQEPSMDDIVRALVEGLQVQIPHILLDQEVDRLLSQTIDDVKRLGMTIEQYLNSTGKTGEELRNDYAKRAATDITLEFALQKVAEDAKITVEEKELDEAIQKAKDEKERAQMEQNRYLLASILRQQKTFDYLKNL